MSGETMMIVQTNINITKELDIRKHLCVSFFVVAIKIISFTTLGCYAVCCTVTIWQINGFEARLKCMAMFLSIFRKRFSPWFNQAVFIVRITELTLKWLWRFRLSIISISGTWAQSSVWCFLSVAFIENSKSYQ